MHKVNKKFSNIRKIYRNLIYNFSLGVALFFLALVISFLLSRFKPPDPVLAIFPSENWWVLESTKPLIEQFFIYIGRMLTGNWGTSNSVSRGTAVIDLVIPSLRQTLDLLVLPLGVGIILGISLGKRSIITKHKWKAKLIQILSLIGLAIPFFSLCLIFKYILCYMFPVFPAEGTQTSWYTEPSSIIKIYDYIYHLILPWTILTIAIGSLVALLTRLNLLNQSKSRSIVPNSFNIVICFSIIFSYLMFIEPIFDLSGLAQLTVSAIRYTDDNLIDVILFLLPMSSVILIMLGNLIFIQYGAHKSKNVISNCSFNEKVNEEIINSKQSNLKYSSTYRKKREGFKIQFKQFRDYYYKKIKSPFTIFGSILLLFFVIISIFPQILTPYSIQEANGVYMGAWNPPSPTHPLGQTIFGRDVLARIVYGVQTSLLFVLIPITVGLIGGLLFGIPMGMLNRRFKIQSDISMIVFFICPVVPFMSIIYLIDLYYIDSYYHLFLLINYGLFLIPFFTLLIAKTRLNGFEIMKKVIPYIPLLTGFILLLQSGMAFLGFSDYQLISLGADISEAIGWLDSAPHAFMFHSIFLFMLIMGFFLLYLGLQKTKQVNLSRS